MSKRTKKVGSSGRLGARYGVRIRKRIADVELEAKGRHECPKCRAKAMTRTASGIWTCNHCGATIASSSYMPTRPVAVRREVSEVLAEAEAKETAKKESKKAAEPEELLVRDEPEETEEIKPEKPRKRKEKE